VDEGIESELNKGLMSSWGLGEGRFLTPCNVIRDGSSVRTSRMPNLLSEDVNHPPQGKFFFPHTPSSNINLF